MGMQAKVRHGRGVWKGSSMQWWIGDGLEVGIGARAGMAMATITNKYIAQTREGWEGGSGAWACRPR